MALMVVLVPVFWAISWFVGIIRVFVLFASGHRSHHG
jgi:hypothetical protein